MMYRLILEDETFGVLIEALHNLAYKADPKTAMSRARVVARTAHRHLTRGDTGWVRKLDPEDALLEERQRDDLARLDNRGRLRTPPASDVDLSEIMAGILANRQRIEELGYIIQESQPRPSQPVMVPVRDKIDPDMDLKGVPSDD